MTQPIPSETVEYERYVDGLRRSNTELLDALRNLYNACEFWENQSDPVLVGARAAIDRSSVWSVEASAPTKTITIHVEGGLVQDITGIPALYELRVEDYDVQNPGDDSWDTEKQCVVTVYEGGARD